VDVGVGTRRKRRDELERVREVLIRATAGRGGVVLVDGEPGIGKTRFLGEVRDLARSQLAVVEATAEPAEMARPFGPLLDAISRSAGAAPVAVAASFAELVRHGRDESSQSGDRRSPLQFIPEGRVRLVDGLAGLMVAWSEAQPLLLTIDDLQWADDATLAVLSVVARSIEHHPLVLVAAIRQGARNDVVRAFVDQRVSAAAVHIALGPLVDVEVASLLADAVGAPAGPRLLHAAEGAGGNPFLLLELVTLLDRRGQIEVHDGVADASETAGDLADPLIRSAPNVLERMAAVDARERHVLQVAAILGGPFSVTDLATALHVNATDLIPLIESSVTAGVLEVDGRFVRFRHDLVREAVAATMGEPVVTATHLQIARAFAAAGARPERVAPHFLRGAEIGDVSAAHWLRQAAKGLVDRAPGSAADLLERAHELLPLTATERDDVAVELVDAAFWCGRLERAVEVAGEVLVRPQPRERAQRLHETMAKALGLLGRPGDAISHAEDLASGDDHPWGIGLTAMLRLFTMDLDGCLRDSERAIRVLSAAGSVADPWAETLALGAQSFVLNIRGYHVQAAEVAERAVAAADRSVGMAAHRLVPLVFHGLALHSSGQEAAAQAAWRRGERLSDELGTAWATPFFHYGRALAHWDEGRWGDLLAESEAALAFARNHDTALAAGFACAISAAAHLFQRRPDAAAALLDEGDQLLARGGIQYGADWLAWMRALHLEACGDRDAALQLLDLAWQLASAVRAEAALSLFGPDLVRMSILAGDIRNADTVLSRLEQAEDDVERTTVDASAKSWRAAMANDTRGLDDVQRIYAGLHRPVQLLFVDEAAMIGALVHGDASEAARRLALVAAAADRLDCPGIADRAERAAVHLGMDMKPERRATRPVTGWAALTDTERAVARMVAAGDGNLDVAEAFGISRRTVESHLYRTYAKLGVRNRTELALVAVRESAPTR